MIKGADVTHLAQAMDEALQATSVRTSPAQQPDYAPVVTIQAGRAGVTPVICIPGAGANITCYVPLTLALSNEVPVYGLQARGLDGNLVPHTTVEAAAQTYVQALLDQHVLNGPCKLVGHSFGGWIAFEMARQLEALGRQVELLVLLDSQPPSALGPRRRAYDRIDAMMELVKLIEMQSSHALGLTHAMLQATADDAQIHLLHQAMIQAGVINARTPLDNVRGLFNVFTRNINTAYTPANGVNTPTILARAANRPTVNMAKPIESMTTPRGPEPDWTALSPVQASLTLAGNHMTLLTRPSIDEIAGLINGVTTGQDQNQAIRKSRSGS
jgi:arthrofactin-type cyclic lipopeptide synthetase C